MAISRRLTGTPLSFPLLSVSPFAKRIRLSKRTRSFERKEEGLNYGADEEATAARCPAK